MGQPTTTPPGGGSWTWDDKNDKFVERVPEPEQPIAQPATPTATPPAAQSAEQPAAPRPATKTPQQPAAAADGQLNVTPQE